MPRVFGPCFSLTASKSLRKKIVYQRKKGLNLVGKYRKPGSREPTEMSDLQACQRADIGFLVVAWQDLTEAERVQWDEDAKSAGFIGTGYHYFIHKKGNQDMATFRKIKIWDGITTWVMDYLGGGVFIDWIHYLVHEGRLFTMADYDLDVDDGNSVLWLLKTPDTDVKIHVAMSISPSNAGLAELFEGPTLTDNGVVKTPVNNNRNSNNEPTMLIFSGPTVDGEQTGTRIDVKQLGGGRKNEFGAEARIEAEWKLKRNTDYLIKFTAQANDTMVSFNVQFYED